MNELLGITMHSFKPLLPLVACCALLTGAQAAPNNDGDTSSPTVIERTGTAIEHGAKATANGVERGARAAGHGIERGLQATGRALNKASDKVSEKLGIGKPADGEKANGNSIASRNDRSG